jgi:hypothetical protein
MTDEELVKYVKVTSDTLNDYLDRCAAAGL